MGLFEVFILDLGTSIAKAILKVWLKDSKIASDITSDLPNLVRSITTNILAQQRTKRQFESIGESVSQNVYSLFHHEAKINENSQIAIVHKVSYVLNNSAIDTKLLVAENLDAEKLANYFKKLHPRITQDLSYVETGLYERILFEVCHNIVDLASELPAFSENVFSEILQREDILINKTDSVIVEVRWLAQLIEKLVLTPDETSKKKLLDAGTEKFENQYRRFVLRNLEMTELLPFNVSRSSRHQGVSIAYVSLEVETRFHKQLKNVQGSEITMDLDRTIINYPRLFILGDAGSGKTTLLQWIAIRAASRSFSKPLEEFNSYLPFFIPLRRLAGKELPTPEDLLSIAAPPLVSTTPKGWVGEKLKSGKALMLIDGLDEIPMSRREDISRWLQGLMIFYPKAHYIICSRPSAVRDQWSKSDDFVEALLLPMTLPDIYKFIDYWHTAVGEVINHETEKKELQLLAINLKNIVTSNKAVAELAINPFLCAMICALHRDRKGRFPSRQIEFYEECIHMLLGSRDIERQIDMRDYPKLSYQQKRALLQRCAYYMMVNGWANISIEHLDEYFSRELATMVAIDHPTTAIDIRNYFLERSGILREVGQGSVQFVHRIFQEYLVALEVIEQGDIKLLMYKADNDEWQEVIILVSGLAREKDVKDIIDGLVEKGKYKKKRKHYFQALAISCLEISSVKSSTRRYLEGKIIGLTS